MVRLRLSLTAAALAIATVTAPSLSARQAAEGTLAERVPYRTFTLPNGLRVVVHSDHATPKVAVAVWYHVGSMNEPDRKSGFAHLFEHLMFNGSENHDSGYLPPLQEVGASEVNGATSSDQTWYYQVVPTGGLERALWLESDRMGHLLGVITQAKLDEQRGVVQNEKRVRESQPYARMAEQIAAGLFPAGHPYHHPVIGSMEDLDAASLDDVKAWFRSYYGAANAVVVLSGDVDFDRAKDLVTRHFGAVPPGPPVDRMTRWVPDLERERAETMQDDVPQTALSWSWAVPGRGTEQQSALRMAAMILGRGRTSRLHQALVLDRPLATHATASYQGSAVAGVFSMEVRLQPDADPREVETIVQEILAEFIEKGPSADELARTKVSYFSDNVRMMESINIRAMALADGMMFTGDPGNFLVEEARFEAVTAADVSRVGGEWLRRPAYRLTVEPRQAYRTLAEGADRSTLPPPGPSPELQLPELQQAVLSNGIRVKFARRSGTPIVDLAMVFDAGHAADQHMKPGLGNFTLGLLSEGTISLDGQQLAERQAMLGARIWSYGDLETSSVALSSLSRSLADSISLWADQIRNPAFRDEDIERSRALRLNGLRQSLLDPGDIAQRTFNHLIYGADHAYGSALAGREEALASITRADILAFRDRWMRADNAAIYAAGDTDFEALVGLLETAFADWKPVDAPKGELAIEPRAAAERARIVLIDRPGVSQSVIRVGQIMPNAHDERAFAIGAMNDILGGGFNSRLNMNLRENKGWTYGANSHVTETLGPAVFTVSTSVQTDRTAQAIAEIDKEIRELVANRPATPEEIALLRNGRVLALPGQFETNQALVGYLQRIDHLGRPHDWITRLPGKYADIDPATITRMAHLIQPERLTWVIVGDRKRIEAEMRALDLDSADIVLMDPNGAIVE